MKFTNHAVVKLGDWCREVEPDTIAGTVLDFRLHLVLVRVSAISTTTDFLHLAGVVWNNRNDTANVRRCRRRHCTGGQRGVVEVNRRQNKEQEWKNHWKRLKLTSTNNVLCEETICLLRLLTAV